MVLGLRSKKKGTSFRVSYDVHIQEIKPWPPSQTLKSLRSVVLQWENGDRSSGATIPAVPSFGSGTTEEGRIEFSESFKLDVTLLKEGSNKGDDRGLFQKNILQFNLYESRKDKSKGHHLGGAAIDLAEHGIIREAVAIVVPVQTKRSFRNAPQPVLYFSIQPSDTGSTSSPPPKEVKPEEVLVGSNGKQSKSTLPNEERSENVEIASFTDDDDDNLHSSIDSSPSAPAANADFSEHSSPSVQEEHKNVSDTLEVNETADNAELLQAVEEDLKPETRKFDVYDATFNQNGSLPTTCLRSNGDRSDSENLSENCDTFHKVEITHGNVEDPPIEKITNKMIEDISIPKETLQKNAITTTDLNVSSDTEIQKEISENSKLEHNIYRATKPQGSREQLEDAVNSPEIMVSMTEKPHKAKENDIDDQYVGDGHKNSSTASAANTNITHAIRKDDSGESNHGKPDLLLFIKKSSDDKVTKIRGMDSINFSVRSSAHSKGCVVNGSSDQYTEDVKEIDTQEIAHDCGTNSGADAGTYDREGISSNSACRVEQAFNADRRSLSRNKVQELEARVKSLEAELREVAAMEIGLYSIVAEHGSSVHKVHTPARRLARLYRHASRKGISERRASVARTIVSGLALVAKACGSDVPRLTFWLSNTIVLRTIVSQTFRNPENAKNAGYWSGTNGSGKFQKNKSSPLKRGSISLKNKNFSGGMDDCEDPETFQLALQKIESWIFHRIVESVWWQTFTPCMHYSSGRCDSNQGMHRKKNNGRTMSMSQKREDNSSIEIWKKAFKDASEKLCPVRGGGHECGCLPLLARIVMEQCVARLDVAMFNVILRESDDVIPTDPISDPISDLKVLPVDFEQLSFGTGAQLKGSIGTWSRRLSDLFGMDVDESIDEVDKLDDNIVTAATSKPFHLLNSLSDLLMLPKDMLLEESMRKEVCPAFSSSMIKQILNRFVADEFSPDPIPTNVFEALDFEGSMKNNTDEIKSIPCNVSPVTYCAPSAALIQSVIGEIPTIFQLHRSGSSLFRKCHTSDDELDDVDLPLASIFTPNAEAKSCGNPSIRYQLLREVWKDDEWS